MKTRVAKVLTTRTGQTTTNLIIMTNELHEILDYYTRIRHYNYTVYCTRDIMCCITSIVT